jgi:hypothetical protein
MHVCTQCTSRVVVVYEDATSTAKPGTLQIATELQAPASHFESSTLPENEVCYDYTDTRINAAIPPHACVSIWTNKPASQLPHHSHVWRSDVQHQAAPSTAQCTQPVPATSSRTASPDQCPCVHNRSTEIPHTATTQPRKTKANPIPNLNFPQISALLPGVCNKRLRQNYACQSLPRQFPVTQPPSCGCSPEPAVSLSTHTGMERIMVEATRCHSS